MAKQDLCKKLHDLGSVPDVSEESRRWTEDYGTGRNFLKVDPSVSRTTAIVLAGGIMRKDLKLPCANAPTLSARAGLEEYTSIPDESRQALLNDFSVLSGALDYQCRSLGTTVLCTDGQPVWIRSDIRNREPRIWQTSAKCLSFDPNQFDVRQAFLTWCDWLPDLFHDFTFSEYALLQFTFRQCSAKLHQAILFGLSDHQKYMHKQGIEPDRWFTFREIRMY